MASATRPPTRRHREEVQAPRLQRAQAPAPEAGVPARRPRRAERARSGRPTGAARLRSVCRTVSPLGEGPRRVPSHATTAMWLVSKLCAHACRGGVRHARSTSRSSTPQVFHLVHLLATPPRLSRLRTAAARAQGTVCSHPTSMVSWQRRAWAASCSERWAMSNASPSASSARHASRPNSGPLSGRWSARQLKTPRRGG